MKTLPSPFPGPIVVDLPDTSPIGCGYCYERDQIDDCGHRYPHCQTCRCSDCRPSDWTYIGRIDDKPVLHRKVIFNG